MQKLGLFQSLSQKLSPQQIQFIKLLQVPTMELESRIEEELEVNPALEEGRDEEERQEEDFDEKEESAQDDIDLDEYLRHDDFGGYKTQGIQGGDEEDKEMPISSQQTLSDSLNDQLGFLKLDERQELVAKQLVGSIEADGYIRRDLDAIVNDLAFSQNVETDVDEVEEVLYKIQTFEPAGIAARNLQECLLLQLERIGELDDVYTLSYQILDLGFDEFTKKHYEKLMKRFDVSEEVLKESVGVITKLNPKPGSTSGNSGKAQYVIPDFILTSEDDKMNLSLNARNAPELKISRSYSEMLNAYSEAKTKDKKMKETISFVKQKLDSAKWFIDAIRQRQNTLLKTMNAIIKYQHEFFLTGDEMNLRPMILKNIAEEVEMDISTISRVANSKAVQTEFGTFPLKFFFSESLTTESGEDVSSKEIKATLKKVILEESKTKPLSDDKIVGVLKEAGYTLARRTVAKYREQLGIPVARMRKEL